MLLPYKNFSFLVFLNAALQRVRNGPFTMNLKTILHPTLPFPAMISLLVFHFVPLIRVQPRFTVTDCYNFKLPDNKNTHFFNAYTVKILIKA